MLKELFDILFAAVITGLAIRHFRSIKPRKPVCTETNPNFFLDRNGQLCYDVLTMDFKGEVHHEQFTLCLDTTEKLAMLLMPAARRVISSHGVVEEAVKQCS